MKDNNPLDKHLKLNRLPSHINDPIVFVADTLNIAWLIAQSVFEEQATPDMALMIFDRLASRLQEQSSLRSAPHVHSTKMDE